MSTIFAIAPRMMDPDTAGWYVGGGQILRYLERNGLLSPRCRGRNFTRYDCKYLDSAINQAGDISFFRKKSERSRRYQVSKSVRLFVMKRDGGLCHYCQLPADSVDHKIAFSNGGSDDAENLVASCMDCNRRKRTKSYQEFKR